MNASAARSNVMDRILANDVATCLWSVSMLLIAPALPPLKTHSKHSPSAPSPHSPQSQGVSRHECPYPVIAGTDQQPLRQSRSSAQRAGVHCPAKPRPGIISVTSCSCSLGLLGTISECYTPLTGSRRSATFPRPHELCFQLRCRSLQFANNGDNGAGNAGRRRL